MDIKQNPFSPYDFLGYFIPGALAVFALYTIGLRVMPGVTHASWSSLQAG